MRSCPRIPRTRTRHPIRSSASITDSFFGDPLLKRARPVWDVQYADYSLAPNSPAFKLGFKKIPTDTIGLRKDFPFDKAARLAPRWRPTRSRRRITSA